MSCLLGGVDTRWGCPEEMCVSTAPALVGLGVEDTGDTHESPDLGPPLFKIGERVVIINKYKGNKSTKRKVTKVICLYISAVLNLYV